MQSQILTSYEVSAYNLSWAAENKIHDDAVAKRFGFAGGLVPGVEVFAYAVHAPVAHWGRAWLERGALEMRFQSPVYDGHVATVEAQHAQGGLALRVVSGGKICASGLASAPSDAAAAVAVASFPQREPPEIAERPAADEVSLAEGVVLCSRPLAATPEVAATYLADVREQDDIYRREQLLHPGLLLRRCNALLVDNVVLPPWVHVGSAMQMLDSAHVGETITARAVVSANYERRGHRLVDLDAVVLANGARPIAQVKHTAIYRLRGDAA